MRNVLNATGVILIAALGLFAIAFAGSENVKKQDRQTKHEVLETLGVSPELYDAFVSGDHDLVFGHSWETIDGVMISDRTEIVDDLRHAGHEARLWWNGEIVTEWPPR